VQGQCGAGVLGMPISYLTRIVEFTATHRIRRADWTDQQNRAEFGKAAVDHSHRYQCRVTVQGRLVAEAGGVMSLAALDVLLAAEVTARLDGRSINDALPELADGRRPAAPLRDGSRCLGGGETGARDAGGGRRTAPGGRVGVRRGVHLPG